MAGQFDKWKRVLSTSSSRPDVYMRDPEKDDKGNITQVFPKIAAPIETNAPENTEDNKNRSLPANAPKQAAANAASKKEADASMVRKHYNRNSRKRQIAGLSTTTMRLDEKTGEAYDSSEVVPPKAKPVSNLLSKGYVKPTGQDPDFTPTPVTDTQVSEISRPGGALTDQKNASKSAQEAERQDLLSGEDAFNTSQSQLDRKMGGNKARRRVGSNLRSLNGVTYDVLDRKAEVMTAKGGAGDYGTYQSDLETAAAANDVIPASTVPAKTSDVEEPKVFDVKPSGYKPTESAGDLAAKKADALLTQGARLAEKKEKEAKAPRKPKRTPGGVPKYKEGPRNLIGSEAITEPDTDVVEGKISSAAYERVQDPAPGREEYDVEGKELAAGYDDPNDIRSTTMREVPSGRPDKVLGHVPVRSPRELAGYEKPTVNKSGNVIPPLAIDTFGSQPTDRKQAEAENKRLRRSRGISVKTTVFDPNVRSARPTRGQTPERAAVLGAIREKRATDLAAEGKEMTTVAPEVMETAKRLGRTSAYNLDENYMSTPSFLAHPAVQDATIAHALGVHHTLGTEDDHLAKYYGGRPLEAQALRAAAFKVVDRNLRGNPEKAAGEFALLRASVHAGTPPTRTLRNLRAGNDTGVVVNGQNVTLSPTSSENRQRIADTTTNITAQTESAPRVARGSVAATPTAPLAGTNRVGVRRVGQPPEASEIREFSPAELRNRKNVPGSDDSKGVRVVDLQGLRPGETSPNKVLKEEKDS
jgi:hypothetical protein